MNSERASAVQPKTTDSPLVRVRDLEKRFNEGEEDEVFALDIDSLDIQEGEFISIVGPSGCGKSTFLRLVSGLLQPSRGTVEIGGTTVTEPVPDIGFVFQSSVLFDWRTVEENVMFPFEALKSNGEVDEARENYEERKDELLELVGLQDFKKAYPKELSGGMQRRVSICRALLPDPSTLLMDEPFSALDEFTREKLNEELLNIWAETGKTIIFVTHNIAEAVFLSDRVVVFSDRPGRVEADIDIGIERPRSLDDRDTEEFVEFTGTVRDKIILDEGMARNE